MTQRQNGRSRQVRGKVGRAFFRADPNVDAAAGSPNQAIELAWVRPLVVAVTHEPNGKEAATCERVEHPLGTRDGQNDAHAKGGELAQREEPTARVDGAGDPAAHVPVRGTGAAQLVGPDARGARLGRGLARRLLFRVADDRHSIGGSQQRVRRRTEIAEGWTLTLAPRLLAIERENRTRKALRAGLHEPVDDEVGSAAGGEVERRLPRRADDD